ncbi:MAG: TldD/PmbA family protein, partial [Acidobacteria bacterium]|nr:TldD/PmbA family protein [Acidobacteriota bacterium]
MTISTDLLSDIIKQAIKRGATDAEAIASETTEFSVEVRLGEIEKLQEAASRGVGLRVLCEGRQASCSTSDVSPEGIEELIANAVEMAKQTSIDEAAILPAREELATEIADLNLFDPAIVELSPERKIEMARAVEDAARRFDPRIINSEGGACNTKIGKMTLVNSIGFAGEYTATNCNLFTAPVAKQDDQMQVGFWGDRQRQLAAMDAPDVIGKEAARRALRKL